MSALWKSLKAADKQPPTNIANADVQMVEMVDGGETTILTDTTPPMSHDRVKFRPVDPSTIKVEPPEPVTRDAPNNFDLVGDDIGNPAPRSGRSGRPRLYPSDAARQLAYRSRKKTGA